MMQLILMLLALVCSNGNTTNNNAPITTQNSEEVGFDSGTEDTGGDTGHKPPTIIPKP